LRCVTPEPHSAESFYKRTAFPAERFTWVVEPLSGGFGAEISAVDPQSRDLHIDLVLWILFGVNIFI
jgi:hypothetical protein